MAYEKLSEKKVIATNLGSYITSQVQLVKQHRLRVSLDEETNFNRAVLEDNLTLDQQLDYRKKQLEKIDKGDKDERRRIEGEISTIKDLIEQKKYSDAYMEEVMKMNDGAQSIDMTIKWLENKLKRTTDQNIIKNIKDNLSSLYTQRYDQRINVITKQTEFANNDKTAAVVEKQIKKINDERANAVNPEYAALLDLQLQSLQKTAAESQVQKTLLNFSVATMTGQSALSLLNEFNSQIENADENMSITVGGVTYENIMQFWELKRSDFLNDRSANGFFSRYKEELSEQVTYKTSRGILTNNSMDDVKGWYDHIKDRPELVEYQDRITNDQQSSLQETAGLRATNILNEFAVKLDAKKAISDLAYLQDTYGVDQTLNYQKIVTSAAKEKEAQVNEILSTMSALLKQNPGMTNQQALEQAVASGAGATFSPEELANKKASTIITESGKKATEQQFGEENPPITQDGKTTFTSPEYKDGDLIKLPQSNTVYVVEGGKLRSFAGNWNEEQFKAYTGKGFNAVKTVSNLSGISQGQAITPNDMNQSAQIGEKVFHADLLKYYKPEDIVSKGQDRFLKQGVNPVWGEKIKPAEWQQLQTQYKPAELEKKIVRAGQDIYYKR